MRKIRSDRVRDTDLWAVTTVPATRLWHVRLNTPVTGQLGQPAFTLIKVPKSTPAIDKPPI